VTSTSKTQRVLMSALSESVPVGKSATGSIQSTTIDSMYFNILPALFVRVENLTN
jgi:hypothetical protein